ncbi:MAG: hypothetical protein AMK70_00465 [Nitrospira bacterium SG8_35_1]|nr:MAG: hypothetical protein AMK70_00465 [Nitrospira bacterium SG8_35_1]
MTLHAFIILNRKGRNRNKAGAYKNDKDTKHKASLYFHGADDLLEFFLSIINKLGYITYLQIAFWIVA